MKGFTNLCYKTEKEQLLHEALQIPDTAHCICAVGAGGKTGLLRALAAEYRRKNKKTLLITTTKMYQTGNGQILDGTAKEIIRCMETEGFAEAGTTLAEGKMGSLPDTVRTKVMKAADVVLVEADGSRRLPLKVPGRGEPALLMECDYLIVVEGMSGVGKPLREVCHRTEEALRLLGEEADEHRTVTVKTVVELAEKGYGTYLKKTGDNGKKAGSMQAEGCFFLNQSDSLSEEQKEILRKELKGKKAVIGSLKKREYQRTF